MWGSSRGRRWICVSELVTRVDPGSGQRGMGRHDWCTNFFFETQELDVGKGGKFERAKPNQWRSTCECQGSGKGWRDLAGPPPHTWIRSAVELNSAFSMTHGFDWSLLPVQSVGPADLCLRCDDKRPVSRKSGRAALFSLVHGGASPGQTTHAGFVLPPLLSPPPQHHVKEAPAVRIPIKSRSFHLPVKNAASSRTNYTINGSVMTSV